MYPTKTPVTGSYIQDGGRAAEGRQNCEAGKLRSVYNLLLVGSAQCYVMSVTLVTRILLQSTSRTSSASPRWHLTALPYKSV